ncbi:MAG: hypothetical protein ACRD96_00750 [Bryobacteraceae bacterium]
MSELAGKMTQADADLRQWVAEQQGLRERLGKLESGIEARLRSTRKQAQEIADAAYRRAAAEFGDRADRLESRVVRVEATHEESGAKLARLEDELGRMKELVAQQREQLVAAERNSRSDHELLHERVGDANRRIDGDRTELTRIARTVDRKRVDFELTRNRSAQLAPGISICVTGTDAAYRRVKGWMWILPDRKTIWLRDQQLNQPVVFYSQDGKRREVVFTHVAKRAAVGYLLLPEEDLLAAANPGRRLSESQP